MTLQFKPHARLPHHETVIHLLEVTEQNFHQVAAALAAQYKAGFSLRAMTSGRALGWRIYYQHPTMHLELELRVGDFVEGTLEGNIIGAMPPHRYKEGGYFPTVIGNQGGINEARQQMEQTDD